MLYEVITQSVGRYPEMHHAAGQRTGFVDLHLVAHARQVGEWLALLKEPEPPKGLKDLMEKWPLFKQVLNMPVKRLSKA